MKLLLALCLLLVPVTASGAGHPLPYQVDRQSYEGYYISAGPNTPFVLLIHDWNGLDDYEIRRANMLAKLGYTVFAADLYGAGVHPKKVEEMRRLSRALYADRPKMREIMYAALAAAKEQGARIDNAVAVGYCFGGAAVLELARSGANLKGFVTFHGVLATPEGEDYSRVKGKLLTFHGTADTSVTMEDFADLAERTEKAGVDHEMITYSGAPHAFTVFGSERYRADADRKSWRRFTEFLADTLGK